MKVPIKFPTMTAAHVAKLTLDQRRAKLADLCLSDAAALELAIAACSRLRIGCFRIFNSILPLKTHPLLGYDVEDLPKGDHIVAAFRRCGELAPSLGIRTSLHLDQFVVLNSPRAPVRESSLRELAYHAEAAEWVGGDVINIHGGGAYGAKQQSLAVLCNVIESLPDNIRRRLTLENDDVTFTPSDLLPVCRRTDTPLVYDVHHHRCLPDELTIDEATSLAIETWDREPLMHISSPREGWSGPLPRRHHVYTDPADFPPTWFGLCAAVEVEAKAQELAVQQLLTLLDADSPTDCCSRKAAVKTRR